MSEPYAPTLEAALARIAAVRPAAYARTRNALDGAVTGLSPYISHGFVSLAEVLAGVRQAYAHRTAESELMKQYEFMYRVFRSARRRLELAQDDADRRRILLLLGDAALDEHAEWIIMHRERPLDQTRIWRLGR